MREILLCDLLGLQRMVMVYYDVELNDRLDLGLTGRVRVRGVVWRPAMAAVEQSCARDGGVGGLRSCAGPHPENRGAAVSAVRRSALLGRWGNVGGSWGRCGLAVLACVRQHPQGPRGRPAGPPNSSSKVRASPFRGDLMSPLWTVVAGQQRFRRSAPLGRPS